MPAAAYVSFSTLSEEWTIRAYSNGTPIPLTAEGLHGSAFSPLQNGGDTGPALSEATRILRDSGYPVASQWAEGPVDGAGEYRAEITPSYYLAPGQTLATKEVHRTRTIDGNTRTRLRIFDAQGNDRTKVLHTMYPNLGAWDRFREAITVTNGSNNPGAQYVSELSRALYGSSTALRHNRITPVPAATTRVQTASKARGR